MENRYEHRYVNEEISVIVDNQEKMELTAETITERLNYETRMHHKFKSEAHFLNTQIKKIFEVIDEMELEAEIKRDEEFKSDDDFADPSWFGGKIEALQELRKQFNEDM